ncbi:hypothetical protein [Marinobacter sp. JSM 1782161]|uniref:hypothetical protein n=1 Tax=Marinobacter sp. JSM 1782161 TaxID=2685906 RepID=UPI0014025BA5|nr:hypothetical protein [Marinobacter sp. JSM 1782161]
MTQQTALIGLVLAACLSAGCADSDGHSNGKDNGNAEVDFNQFVKAEIDNTRDDRDAVAINELEFQFNNQDDEDAFDDVLE